MTTAYHTNMKHARARDRHRVRGLRNVTVHVALCIIAMLLVAVAALRLGVPERVRCVVSFGWG